LLDGLDLGGGQGIDIDLQAHGQGGPRTHALHEFMKFEHASPERFVAEGIEAEDLSTIRDQLVGILLDLKVEGILGGGAGGGSPRERGGEDHAEDAYAEQDGKPGGDPGPFPPRSLAPPSVRRTHPVRPGSCPGADWLPDAYSHCLSLQMTVLS